MLTVADYNPTVLYLVTLPNFLLVWALHQREAGGPLRDAFLEDGELELTSDVVDGFKRFLAANQITLSFVSGAWSPEFVELLCRPDTAPSLPETSRTLVIGAETIYSPFALTSFTETLLAILESERTALQNGSSVAAIVAAKRLYFGVGGSLDDFVDKMRGLGVHVETVREETEGVRRGVVRCSLP